MEELEEARSLIAGMPPSPVQANVLVEVSRYEMLADRNESAIEVGREVLTMAEELGLELVRAKALNNMGSARVHSGDPGGVHDLEQSVAIAERIKDIPELIRAHNNVGVMHLVLGNRPGWEAGILEAHRLALHFGHQGFARWSEGGPVLLVSFHRGDWDELQSGAEEFLADESPSYQSSSAYAWRGMVRVARGDLEGAEDDAERALELARPAKDPQVILSAFPMAAVIFLSAGNEARAGETLDEILAEVRRLPQLGFGTTWAHGWVWVARALGRSDEALAALRDEPLQTPWVDAALAVAAGDFRRAADVMAGLGSVPFEMFYRLRAAEALVAEGRRAEADEQLRPALAFYRSVRATRYVQEGEALLAVSA
jgi:tetratricopeptide (TPR) repeat protein